MYPFSKSNKLSNCNNNKKENNSAGNLIISSVNKKLLNSVRQNT